MFNTILHCPNCNHTVHPKARTCPRCKVNLGVAAIRETRRINTAVSSQPSPINPEALFPRLGEYLVSKGFVAQDELDIVLAQQSELSAQGETKRLGQLLIENNFVNQADLDTAITEQMFDLKSSLEESNKQLESRVAERTAELEQTMVQLGRLDKMKDNFVSNVSHELRTPLAILVGHLDLMSQGDPGSLTFDQKQSLSSMTDATRRLWTLIEDLLQFSDAASGKMTLKKSPFPIIKSVNTAVSQKETQATARQIILNTRIRANLPQVFADQEKITWVVGQLLDNAIKFTPPSGQVVAYAQQKADDVQINVVDTGIGIPEEHINELFHSFYQLEESSTRHHEGMGLGLAMAQKILTAHGSTIQVRSRVGVGSHFAFSLPRHH